MTNTKEPDPKPSGRARARKPAAPPKTKATQLVELLSRNAGADLETMSRKLGWQAHTTRAALSRLRKAGYAISSEKPASGKASRYRITATPAE